MDFIIELQRYYRKMICKNTRYNYQDEKELANEVLSFIKKKQYVYDYVIEYEYTIYPDQENKGIGDIRISFEDVIIVIELKVIHSTRTYGSGKTERTSRNKKRNKVMQQVRYYAEATKRDNPGKIVIPVSITDEKFVVLPEVRSQNMYPWEDHIQRFDMSQFPALCA